MEDKKYKLFRRKKSITIISGLVLGLASPVVAYHICPFLFGGKPFVENQYEAHKIIIDETTKDGQKKVEEYISYDKELLSAVLIKTPYTIGKNECVLRSVYEIPSSRFSNVELDYMINNISDQENLINQDFLEKYFNYIKNNPISTDEIKVEYEYAESIPDDNQYEICYASYDQNLNEVQLVTNKIYDRNIDILFYFLCFIGITAVSSITFLNLKYIDAEKKRELQSSQKKHLNENVIKYLR